jgi:hypothetical protein
VDNSELVQYLRDCLLHKNFIVMYEAARTHCKMEMFTAVQVRTFSRTFFVFI